MLFIGDTFQVRRYHSERVLPRDLRHHWVVTGGRGRGIIVYSKYCVAPYLSPATGSGSTRFSNTVSRDETRYVCP